MSFNHEEARQLLEALKEAMTPAYLRKHRPGQREPLGDTGPVEVTRQALERADLFDALGNKRRLEEITIRVWRCSRCQARYKVELGDDQTRLDPRCPNCNGLLVFP